MSIFFIQILFWNFLDFYVYTSGFDESKIMYSEDGKILRILFENGLHNPYEIHLSSAYDADGRVIKDISIYIKK